MPLSIYLAGQLKNPHHLPIATELAARVDRISEHKLALVLSQNFKPRPQTQIQEDFLRLLDCQGALFVGESLSLIEESLAEILLALLAELPILIICTDTGTPHPYALEQLNNFLGRGNAQVESADLEALYQSGFLASPMTEQEDVSLEGQSLKVTERLLSALARNIVTALEGLTATSGSSARKCSSDILGHLKTLLGHKMLG